MFCLLKWPEYSTKGIALYMNGKSIFDLYINNDINIDTIDNYYDEIYVRMYNDDIKKFYIEFFIKNEIVYAPVELLLVYHIARYKKTLKFINDEYWIPIRFILRQTFANFLNFNDYAFDYESGIANNVSQHINRTSICHLLFKNAIDVCIDDYDDYYIHKSDDNERNIMYLSIKIYDDRNININVVRRENYDVTLYFYQEYVADFHDNLKSEVTCNFNQKIDL